MIHIGIDGDGTLYNIRGDITHTDIPPLLQIINETHGKLRIYHLTGKDVDYTEYLRFKYPDVIRSFDYHLLENGAVLYDGQITQLLVVKGNSIEIIDSYPEFSEKLEAIANRLINKGLQNNLIKVRQASVQYRGPLDKRGDDLARINHWLNDDVFPGEFYATMSAYAIFINQRGISKWTALSKVAGSEMTCAIGDSLNDFESLTNSNYGFMPANVAPVLIDKLKSANYRVVPLENFDHSAKQHGLIYIANSNLTAGVIEILQSIREKLL